MCAKQEMSRWLEEWYGPYTKQMQESLRLPKDKYDASVAAFKVNNDAAKYGRGSGVKSPSPVQEVMRSNLD